MPKTSTPLAVGDPCPDCGTPMTAGDPGARNRHRLSADHILPRERRPGRWLPRDVTNLRTCCQECNADRATAGHCVGALACARAVAADRRRSRIGNTVRAIMHRWHFPTIALAAERAFQARLVDLPVGPAYAPPMRPKRPRNAAGRLIRPEVVAAAKAEQARLRIEALLDRIPADEFAHPAATPAARVWNVATLARHGIGGIVGGP